MSEMCWAKKIIIPLRVANKQYETQSQKKKHCS